MVASISARKSIASAQQYFTHLKTDDYYSLDHQNTSRWLGRGSKILGLEGIVEKHVFGQVLNGTCPFSGQKLVQPGQKHKKHAPGWDITLSAPKAVSILWGLAPNTETRLAIQRAHLNASTATIAYIEENHIWCRRGQGGRTHEKTAGAVVAAFTHYTSRNQDMALHDHLFIQNMAPRKDGTWGAIQSKPLYNAQKLIGNVYRESLAQELNKLHIPAQHLNETIRISGITKKAEQTFSTRRQEILKAVETYNYQRNARGFEKATLRTRRKKQHVPESELFHVWKMHANQQGIHIGKVFENYAQLKHSETTANTQSTRYVLLKPTPQIVAYFVEAARNVLKTAPQMAPYYWIEIAKLAAKKLTELLHLDHWKKHPRENDTRRERKR